MKNHHHLGKETKNAFGQPVIKPLRVFRALKFKLGKFLSLIIFPFFFSRRQFNEAYLLCCISGTKERGKESKINECLGQGLIWELETEERKALGEKIEE